MERLFWNKADAGRVYSVIHGHPHPVTRQIKIKEQEIMASLMKDTDRIVWIGIGTGEVAKDILRDMRLKKDILGIEINPDLAEIANFTLRQYANDLKIVISDVTDAGVDARKKDLVLLDFGTYGNLGDKARLKSLQIIKEAVAKDGIAMITVFDPKSRDDHLNRYRWDIGSGIVDGLSEVNLVDGGIEYKFHYKGLEVFSRHLTAEGMRKELTDFGFGEDQIKVEPCNFANIFIIRK